MSFDTVVFGGVGGCTEVTVEITFHSNAVACNTVESHINSVILSTKSGFVSVSAKNFIDASEDANLVKMCGRNM